MIYKPPDIEGWMSVSELEWLFLRAREMRSVVEIGCWKGKSTHALLSGCPGPVFAVDHFKGSENELHGAHAEAKKKDISLDFISNVGMFKNLVLMRMESTEAAKYFREKSVDMIFIDGCHKEDAVRKDISCWLPICRRLFCGHDTEMVKGVLKDMIPNFKKINGTSIWSIEL